MTTYLYRRSGGTYYFRRAIPVELRGAAGKREWIRSLDTKALSEAKRRLPLLMSEATTQEAALRLDAKSSGDATAQCISQKPITIAPLGGAASKPSKVANSAPPLLELFDRYAAQQRIKPATTNEWRSILARLILFLGHDDVCRISAVDLDRWRDSLLAETTKNGMARDPRTVRTKHLCAVRATLNWAVEQRYIKDNAARKVVVRAPKKAQLRSRDFTPAEAKAILAATLAPSPRQLSAEQALARRWIPWLCAYTGARVNEITQLRGTDVYQIDGIWALRITPEAGTVKSNVARSIPLHPDLIAQGFLAAALPKAGDPIFFCTDSIKTPGYGNRYFKKVGERIAAWVRNEVRVDDPGIHPNHAWRHTFKTIAIDAELQSRVADYLLGHGHRSVGDSYGSVSLKTAYMGVMRMDFSAFSSVFENFKRLR